MHWECLGKLFTYILLNAQSLTSSMVQWVKALAAKSADLSSIPETHMVKGKTERHRSCHTQAVECTHHLINK